MQMKNEERTTQDSLSENSFNQNSLNQMMSELYNYRLPPSGKAVDDILTKIDDLVKENEIALTEPEQSQIGHLDRDTLQDAISAKFAVAEELVERGEYEYALHFVKEACEFAKKGGVSLNEEQRSLALVVIENGLSTSTEIKRRNQEPDRNAVEGENISSKTS